MGNKMVKYADDMYAKFTGKTAPDRVGTRYEAAKDFATKLYAANALSVRSVVEKVRSILSANDVPIGVWGVYIAFAEKLAVKALSYGGVVPTAVVEGFKTEYTLKGADPAILDKIALLFAPR
jgi:hypothetical protein